MAGADEGDPHGGSSVTGETQSSVDNTSQASVTTPALAAAGYQQDRARPDDRPASLSGRSPLNKVLFQAKPLFWTKPRKQKASQTKRPPEAVFLSLSWWSAHSLVANHLAMPIRETSPVPSSAAAGTGAGHHDDRAGNDDNGFAVVRAASAHRTTVKARTASTLYLDDHVGRSLARGKRHGLRGAAR
jgi:hypothetical protein